MEKNGQSAIEFMIIVGALMFFLALFLFFIQSDLSEKNSLKRDAVISEIALTVKDEVDLAYKSSDGYLRDFSLPTPLAGQNYSIIINSNLVYVKTSDEQHAVAYPIFNVTGQPKQGSNTIRKENGIVYLN